tara:strand:+ start:2153 stop:3199 length:1047 start_codon:yes stop_codon:yes gene_type:complete
MPCLRVKTILILLSLLFTTPNVKCQTLVLEKPVFRAPEKELMYFFSETYFLDLQNYSGRVKEVEKVHTVYNPDKIIISLDTSKIKPTYKIIKNSALSKTPILDFIGIDSISKINHKFQLFHFDEELDYIYQMYELKNGQIVSMIDHTSVLYYQTEYNYNSQNNVLKAVTINDYGIEKIEIATYNKNGTISSKKRFETNDGVNVTTTNYRYKDELLIQAETQSILYFVPLDEVKTQLDKIEYSEYTDGGTFKNLNVIKFMFNDKRELIKVAESSKGFSENEGVNFESNSTFTLEHRPNHLIIHAELPEKRTYEYIFDDSGNPKEINSYVVDADQTWLHKKTILKVLYEE